MHPLKLEVGIGMPDIGTAITGSNGYLLRERPGWDVPVNQTAAMLMSQGFSDRDVPILRAYEQLGVLTAEQIGRAFFNDARSAYTRLRFLESRRFLARLPVGGSTIHRAMGCGHLSGSATADGKGQHRHKRGNPAYVLDWNGYYLLKRWYGYATRNWQPATVGVVNARIEHSLGISEAWSYLVVAVRATHDLDFAACDDPLRDKWSYRLQVGFLNERQSYLTRKRAALLARLAAASGGESTYSRADECDFEDGSLKESAHALLRPDGCFVLSIKGADRGSLAGSGKVTRANVANAAKEWAPGSSRSRRWDPTLSSWRSALLDSVPTLGMMIASEVGDETTYRPLLLEMETGTNHHRTLMHKVETYNRLARHHKQAWETAYGVSPRVLVVVRTDNQINDQTRIWRTYSDFDGETSVLLVSLQTLSHVFSVGLSAADKRRALIDQPCWLDVMAQGQPTWKPFGEALYLTPAM